MNPSHQPRTGPRQQAALCAISNHWRAFGESPTRAELGRALAISAVSAHLLVGKLARDGLVEVAPRMHLGILVVATGDCHAGYAPAGAMR